MYRQSQKSPYMVKMVPLPPKVLYMGTMGTRTGEWFLFALLLIKTFQYITEKKNAINSYVYRLQDHPV